MASSGGTGLGTGRSSVLKIWPSLLPVHPLAKAGSEVLTDTFLLEQHSGVEGG